ncbi:tetratricopeptide repeat protein [Roseofilum sp. Guam]|uniref:tetratricopeptide repeat protein n=1 Tax=Roseofilum sp. Guam TaxID=2821502 RepID=UPI001B2C7871|nr:tetratricopeptide repeat protein [Roseofilum sp. Guam]MBP0026816.1 tetratricopeptide repeat protein [Roseofilum sp. Guam]
MIQQKGRSLIKIWAMLLSFGMVLNPQLAWGQELQELFRQAEEARKAGNFQAAEEIWRQVIEQDPNNAPAYLGLGNRLRDQNKLEEAIAAYEKAIEVDPNYAFAYVGLGNALRSDDQLEAAKTQYEQAIELNPNLPGVYWNLGNVLTELGNLEPAIAQFRIALKLKPDSVPVYNDLGDVLLQLGNVEEAIAIYNEAINLGSRYPSTYVGLGNALQENNQQEQAIEAYKSAIQLDDFEISAYFALGDIYYQQEDWPQAVEVYQVGVKLQEDYRVYMALGYAWQQLGKLPEAIAAYENAINQDPNGVQAHYNLLESQRLLALEETSNASEDENEVSENPETLSPLAPIARIITPIANGVNIGTGWVVQRTEDRALVVASREAIAHASSLENDQIQVEFFQPSEAELLPRYSAKLMHITPEEAATNLVVLEVAGIPETIQPLEISTELGDRDVELIGHPFNADPWQTVSGSLDTDAQPLEIEANLTQGYAGSPIFNQDRQVVAILGNVGESRTEHETLFTPAISETGVVYPMDLIKEQLEAWGVWETE